MDICCEFLNLIHCPPALRARIVGGCDFPSICGTVEIFQGCSGVYIASCIEGLPPGRVLGFHIHSGECCCGGCGKDPFPNTKGHFIKNCGNPRGNLHPFHAGDMPPLFTNCGCAFSVVYSDRFCAADVCGKTVVIHAGADDFHSQPSGNSGRKIACGKLKPC